jgi:hypothetical protein
VQRDIEDMINSAPAVFANGVSRVPYDYLFHTVRLDGTEIRSDRIVVPTLTAYQHKSLEELSRIVMYDQLLHDYFSHMHAEVDGKPVALSEHILFPQPIGINTRNGMVAGARYARLEGIRLCDADMKEVRSSGRYDMLKRVAEQCMDVILPHQDIKPENMILLENPLRIGIIDPNAVQDSFEKSGIFRYKGLWNYDHRRNLTNAL